MHSYSLTKFDHRSSLKININKIKDQRSRIRVPFSPDDLTKLFNSKNYLTGDHKTLAHFWVPLIGLLTGARLNEICQLRREDIIKDDLSGIWHFDFNDKDEEKSIKTHAGIRLVPIHDKLLGFGLLEYVNDLKKNSRLFPQLRKTPNGYGDSISKWFNRTYKNKNNCDIEVQDGIMKDFHSFRSTLINTLKQNNVPLSIAREIVGHEDDSLTYGGYADPLDLPNRALHLNGIQYPSIDFSKIKPIHYAKDDSK